MCCSQGRAWWPGRDHHSYDVIKRVGCKKKRQIPQPTNGKTDTFRFVRKTPSSGQVEGQLERELEGMKPLK